MHGAEGQNGFAPAAEMGVADIMHLRRNAKGIVHQGIDPAGDRHVFTGKLDGDPAAPQQIQTADGHEQRAQFAQLAAGLFQRKTAKLFFAVGCKRHGQMSLPVLFS